MRFLLGIFLIFMGCASRPALTTHFDKEMLLTRDIAVILPPDNETTDVGASDTYRKAMTTLMVISGIYPLASTAEDELLRRMGVVDGGQLRKVDPSTITASLGGDHLVYGKVEDFSYVNLGIYGHRTAKFSAEIKSVDGKSYWAGYGEGKVAKAAGNLAEALGNLVGGLAEQAVEGMLNIKLWEESTMAVMNLRSRFPEWPVPGTATLSQIEKDLKVQEKK